MRSVCAHAHARSRARQRGGVEGGRQPARERQAVSAREGRYETHGPHPLHQQRQTTYLGADGPALFVRAVCLGDGDCLVVLVERVPELLPCRRHRLAVATPPGEHGCAERHPHASAAPVDPRPRGLGRRLANALHPPARVRQLCSRLCSHARARARGGLNRARLTGHKT